MMIGRLPSRLGFGIVDTAIALIFIFLAAFLLFFHRPARRFIRESLMQRVTSAHYRIQCPHGELTQEVMTKFVVEREPLFSGLDRKLNDAASNSEIKLIFDANYKVLTPEAGAEPYLVTGTTVRTGLDGRMPILDPSADAEALLSIVWGKPGNRVIAHWTALWLASASGGDDLGMAAAQVEQRLGHKKVADLLRQATDTGISSRDMAALGAAWINEIAELGGPADVQKLYSEKMDRPDMTDTAKALATTSTEVERKWQMWIYAYLAGMPPAGGAMTMPMDMKMESSK
jgi:hypothetical protein